MADPKTLAPMQRVQSSNVLSVGYAPERKVLYIRFKASARSGPRPLYRYLNVGPRIINNLLASSSKGKYVWRRIRGRYRCDRWDGARWRHRGDDEAARAYRRNQARRVRELTRERIRARIKAQRKARSR